ncbi:hypothetical protein ACET3Z_015697 [Daucus carota]
MADIKSSNIVANSPGVMGMQASRQDEERKNNNIVETLLRLLPMALCLSALVLMLKNSQSNDFGSVSYSDLAAFRYLVHANGVCAAYSLLSAIVSAVPRPSTMPRAWTFFLLDQMFTYIVLGAGAISTEVIYLAYKGNAATTWSSACESFGIFCHKATAALILTFGVVVCYALLSLMSSYRLFSKYDAPVAYSNKGIEITPAFRA